MIPADESDLQWFAKELAEALTVKARGLLGGDDGGLKDFTLLNRAVRLRFNRMNGWPFLGWEADPKHVEITTETLGLRRTDGTKTLRSAGTKRSIEEVKTATDLSEDQTRTYRSVCMTINYVAQDKPEILFATKGMVRVASPLNILAREMTEMCGLDSSRERRRDSRRTIQVTPSRCRLGPCQGA